MENLVLSRGSNASSNFNNMTDEQRQEWHRALLIDADRENYRNETLEILLHYRIALRRAQAFNVESNAIDAAIASHGLYATNGDPNTVHEEPQPPPMRHARIEQPEQEHQHTICSTAGSGGSDGGDLGTHSHSICSSDCPSYLSLDYLFETYEAPAAADAAAGDRNNAGSSSSSSSSSDNNNTNNNNVIHLNNNNDSSSKNNNEPDEAEINDLAIQNSIDSLGLRRT